MNLKQALTKIAEQLNLDAAELMAYASEDDIGGWDPDAPAATRAWHPGSIFENEGKVLYALAKALKPMLVMVSGKDACVREHASAANVSVVGSRHQWTTRDPIFVFDDGTHERQDVADLARRVNQDSPPGTVYIIHDTHHPAHRDNVRAGIRDAGLDGIAYYLIEPSDCGIGIWQKPGEDTPTVSKRTFKAEESRPVKKREEPRPIGDVVEFSVKDDSLYVDGLSEAQNESLNERFNIDTINTATTGELKQIPGIGSRAIAKIRETYPFVTE